MVLLGAWNKKKCFKLQVQKTSLKLQRFKIVPIIVYVIRTKTQIGLCQIAVSAQSDIAIYWPGWHSAWGAVNQIDLPCHVK